MPDIWLHLYWNAFKNEKSALLEESRDEGSLGIQPGDQTVARFILPELLLPGQQVHFKLEFEAKIPSGILRTGYYRDSYFIAQWFPKKYVVGACGKQVSAVSDKKGVKVTYTFAQKNIQDFAWTAAPNFIKVERDFISAQEVTEEEYRKVAGILNSLPRTLNCRTLR